MHNPENLESHMVHIDRPPEKTDIRWQVHEWLFPRLPSLYAAVNPLITEVNTLLNNPNVPEDEKWLFHPKDGKTPSIKFLLYENIVHNRQATALVFDQAFTIRVFSTGEHTAVIPMGHIDETIYYAYWVTKRSEKNIPPLPKDFVQGYLEPAGKGFALKSIFLNGWDCRPQFDAATAIPGFSTKDYYTICFFPHYSAEYRAELVAELLKKHPNLPLIEQTRKQLLAYNPKKT